MLKSIWITKVEADWPPSGNRAAEAHEHQQQTIQRRAKSSQTKNEEDMCVYMYCRGKQRNMRD